MFKKLLVSSMVLAASSTVAFAGHAYKGEHDYKAEAAPVCPANVFTAGPYIGLSVGSRVNTTSNPANYRGFEGNLNAGYGAMLTPAFYLAGEIYVGDSANIKNEKDWHGNGVKTTWNYGLDIIPGYMLTDTVLGYLRAGVVRARFQDQSDNKTGGRVGLGLQTSLNTNWDLRGEYVWNRFGSPSGLGNVTSNQANIGLIYKFV